MAPESQRANGWRRAIAGVAVATGLMAAFGSGIASADVLDDIASEYDTGAGGGQISNLIHDALKLRALGFLPSKGNYAELQDGLDRRPNQVPLINALKATVDFQRKTQARTVKPSNPTTIGINTYNPANDSVLGGFTISGPPLGGG
ncbi:hypothetical protein [Mycolicibacterium sp. J2]|uniref:hypothetical protein n=1 Tax=Mycolicibacterium sp. J2 TaxID=2993511 RepID=UPI00224AA025|nr:hypothetical protein [Mycolicibacterium sp. J2]MCX2715296.1 hypothetical protein [Mycolicibacterium sp. J2]